MRTPIKRKCLAEFHAVGGTVKLFAVTVAESHKDGGYTLERYDVDLSKEYGYVFHMIGAGGSMPEPVDGLYHRTDGFRVKERASKRMLNRTQRLRQLPKEFQGPGDILDWLENHAIRDETVYCSTCDDYLPSESLCSHCWWCDTVGWYVTPDKGSVCFDPDCWTCSRRY